MSLRTSFWSPKKAQHGTIEVVIILTSSSIVHTCFRAFLGRFFAAFYQLVFLLFLAKLALTLLPARLARFQDLHDECLRDKRQNSQEGSFLHIFSSVSRFENSCEFCRKGFTVYQRVYRGLLNLFTLTLLSLCLKHRPHRARVLSWKNLSFVSVHSSVASYRDSENQGREKKIILSFLATFLKGDPVD